MPRLQPLPLLAIAARAEVGAIAIILLSPEAGLWHIYECQWGQAILSTAIPWGQIMCYSATCLLLLPLKATLPSPQLLWPSPEHSTGGLGITLPLPTIASAHMYHWGTWGQACPAQLHPLVSAWECHLGSGITLPHPSSLAPEYSSQSPKDGTTQPATTTAGTHLNASPEGLSTCCSHLQHQF